MTSLALAHVKKAFGGRPVLEDVTFSVAAGECVGLCGENGAGKTTLLRIIMGLERPDGGEVRTTASLGMVHQHFSLVPALTVAENVWLGREPMRRLSFDRDAAAAQTVALAKRLGMTIDPQAVVEDLSVGQKQRVELLKALRTETELLLLDEPTAVLGPQDTDAFLELLQTLKSRGIAIVLVTHKLKEIARVCSRAVVLHKGRIVADQAPTLAALPALADAMVGGGGNGEKALAPRVPRASAPSAEVRVQLAGVGTGELSDASLTVRRGEIMGVAGVEGNGQEALFRVIVGLDAPARGTLSLDGKPAPASPAKLRALGVRAIASDRHIDAVLPHMSAGENARLGHVTSDAAIREAMERFDVRPLDPDLAIESFSGGNQQKIMFARELGGAASLIVANQPTRGIDFLARDRIWSALAALADAGASVVVISSDTDELRALSDRMAVMYRGKIGEALAIGEWTDEKLGAAMAGA
ncbi:MAG: ATP-binding cassette domain-containing protein [Deltaproteobacteria bacterium]|nr:ATP-binding cassette domain-containing protein [Deltaproteobacteria bacterium]